MTFGVTPCIPIKEPNMLVPSFRNANKEDHKSSGYLPSDKLGLLALLAWLVGLLLIAGNLVL